MGKVISLFSGRADWKKDFGKAVFDQGHRSELIKRAAEQGRQEGMKESPPSNATGPCQVEKGFEQHFVRLAREEYNHSDSKLSRLEQERSELIGRLENSFIKEPREEAKQFCMEAQIRRAAEMERGVRNRNHCKKQLAAFRDKHQGADGFSTKRIRYFYLALFAFLVVESLANGYFFGAAFERGWSEGAVVALFIASLSIALSFSAGVGVRAIYGDGWPRRVLAIMAGILYGVGISCYHLVIGWFRASIIWGDPDKAVAVALQHFLNHPMSLPDLFSWGLVLIGLFFGGTAFIAGLHNKDVRLMSVFARFSREFEKAEEEVRNLQKSYLADLNRAHMESMTKIESRLKVSQEAGHHLRRNVLDSHAVLNQHEYVVNYIVDLWRSTVTSFRRSNETVRSTPSPSYFRETPPLLQGIIDFTIDKNALKQADQLVASMNDRLQKLQNTAEAEKSNIREDYEAHLKQASAFLMKVENTVEQEPIESPTVSTTQEYGQQTLRAVHTN